MKHATEHAKQIKLQCTDLAGVVRGYHGNIADTMSGQVVLMLKKNSGNKTTSDRCLVHVIFYLTDWSEVDSTSLA
jgi:hypothetical protein